MHRHHILPVRLGGSNAAENITPPISTALHAAFHKDLWEHYGQQEDYIAWKALEGRLTSEQARLAAAHAGQQKSEKYLNTRKELGLRLRKTATFETCSVGGKKAAPTLVAWQRANAEAFSAQCSASGKKGAPKRCIPHSYKGKVYPSKRDLQRALKLSICGFYGKLRRGEIQRL